jgi:hypothetical protein
LNRVDAAAFVDAEAKIDGGDGVRALRRHEEEDEKRHERGKGKGPLALFIRRRDKQPAQESRSPKNGVHDSSVASIVGGPSMKVGYTQCLITDDVMAIYHDPGR